MSISGGAAMSENHVHDKAFRETAELAIAKVLKELENDTGLIVCTRIEVNRQVTWKGGEKLTDGSRVSDVVHNVVIHLVLPR